jgi:DNA (cytosine-5)-methyltransferase 1
VEQMIGNAVPVKLGQYIAECFLQYIGDNDRVARRVVMKQLELFPANLYRQNTEFCK